MHIDIIPNRGSRPAVLLRTSYRDGQTVRKHTLANLSELPMEMIEDLRRVLRGEKLVPLDALGLEVVRSAPHGAVAAVVGTARKLGVESLLASRASRERSVAFALICARVLEPGSKLATARGLDPQTEGSTLGQVLELGAVDADACYAALDWLRARQARIEAKLAARHLQEGSLVLWDVTSTYFEGQCCALARRGYSRDGRTDRAQIVLGVLTNAEGCPLAVEVFEGNTADPNTLTSQVHKLQERFGLARVVLVGDRGLITSARIRHDLKPAGLDWITALRAPQIRKLVQAEELQLTLFDQQDLAEIFSAAFPGERLIACRNPLLAEERARKRQELLAVTEHALEQVAEAARRAKRPLQGKTRIGLRVGRVLSRYKMAKHFHLDITDTSFTYARKEAAIAQEAALDGIYVIRTSIGAQQLDAAAAVAAYKSLDHVERAFRTFKGLDLQVRPIYHHLSERVRAHVFLCLLAYYIEWHMRQALAPLLFMEEDAAAAQQERTSVVQPARRSRTTQQKVQRRRTSAGLPVHSFRTLLHQLATLTRNTVRLGPTTFEQITKPTTLQQRAFDLLDVPLRL